ncbi:MAG: hypothetical protein ABW201_17875 [Candidatus Thiodiazotropha sp.]
MIVPHDQEDPVFTYVLATERQALLSTRALRGIPQKAKRLILSQHFTSMGSTLTGDKDYDQVAFHTGGMKEAYLGHPGVFDFDHAPFFVNAWNIVSVYCG